jgi:hypothetical protein
MLLTNQAASVHTSSKNTHDSACAHASDAEKSTLTQTNNQLLRLDPLENNYYLHVPSLISPYQDVMKTHFSGSSARDIGTLFHLKQNFGHRQVKATTSQCYNHTWDFAKVI